MRGVWAEDACFAYAQLQNAQLTDACLVRSNLSGVNAQQSILRGVDFTAANLELVNLSFADLEGAILKRANLKGCVCSFTLFGASWNVDEGTYIDSNNHACIGMALLNRAWTVEQTQFALYIQFQNKLCWPGFYQLLLQGSLSQMEWARKTLFSFTSLQTKIAGYAEFLEQRLAALRTTFEQLPDGYRDLAQHQIEQYLNKDTNGPSSRDLFCYLSGLFQAQAQLYPQEQQKHIQDCLKLLASMAGKEGEAFPEQATSVQERARNFDPFLEDDDLP